MTIRKKSRVSVCVVLAVCLFLPGAAAAASEKILVTVGTETISQADVEAKTSKLPPQLRSRFETPAGRKQLLEQVVLNSLLSQEARRLGLEKQDEVARKIKEMTDNILVQELNRQIVSRKITLSDQEIAEYYQQNKKDFVRPEQVNASVIMFAVSAGADADVKKKKRQLARKALNRLKKGADFAEVARDLSEDKRTQRRGGVTGFFAQGRRAGIYGKNFEQVVFGLETGEASDVFETDRGYFIARVDDRQPRTEKSLAESKKKIERRLKQVKQREAYEAYVEGLKEKYPVKYSE